MLISRISGINRGLIEINWGAIGATSQALNPKQICFTVYLNSSHYYTYI
jgi:hypothetical protein